MAIQTPSMADIMTKCLVDMMRVAFEQIEAERDTHPENGPGLLNREQAAAYLAIGVTSLDELKREGILKPITIDGGTWPKYIKKDLDRYIERKRKEQY